MAATKKAKGNYHRLKTQRWLELEGWTVATLEHNSSYTYLDKSTGELKKAFRTNDTWGADLMARNSERLVFVQVKANRGDVNKGAREMVGDGDWPETHAVQRWVVWWPPRSMTRAGPEILVLEDQ